MIPRGFLTGLLSARKKKTSASWIISLNIVSRLGIIVFFFFYLQEYENYYVYFSAIIIYKHD